MNVLFIRHRECVYYILIESLYNPTLTHTHGQSSLQFKRGKSLSVDDTRYRCTEIRYVYTDVREMQPTCKHALQQ